MSDDLPLEIHAKIMNRLPVKSLLQIRSVCKPWKSLIDSADFIKHYRGQLQHLLVRYKDTVSFEEKFVLIADDHTFPSQKVSLTVPPSLNMLLNPRIIGCSYGLLCLYSNYTVGCDGTISGPGRAVIWNPCIRKAVTVGVPNVEHTRMTYETVLGFGVCRETNDPKIVKITHTNQWGHRKSVTSIAWQVEVYTSCTRAWRCSYRNPPRKSIEFDDYNIVVVDGVLYFLANDMDHGVGLCILIISFDVTSEEFIEVKLPYSLAQNFMRHLSIFKVRESLVVVEEGVEAINNLHVWMTDDVVAKPFTKLFTICMPDALAVWVTGFRKTGEPIIDSAQYHPEWSGSPAVYEPCSKSISVLGINGRDFSCVGSSYIETLLLL